MKRLLLIALILVLSLSLIPAIAVGSGITDWDSVGELESFLNQDDSDRHIILKCNADGIAQLNNQCEDRAFNLRDRAEVIGKRLETEVLDRHEYYKWYGVWLKPNHYHVINKAQIGNEWWYVDPETDEHWLALYLD